MLYDDQQLSLNPASALLAHDQDRTSAGHHLPVAFTPEGEHGIRVVGDLHGKLYRFLDTHQYKKYRCYCPEFFRERDPSGDYPSCAICTVATQRGDWRLRREALVLVYGALYHTSHPSQYWQPGKTYLMIAPAALCIGLTQFVAQGSAQQQEHFFTMVNPQHPGPAILVKVQKGPRASVAVTSFTAEAFPPLTLGEWYRPLRDCWIGAEFRLADYEALVTQVTA